MDEQAALVKYAIEILITVFVGVFGVMGWLFRQIQKLKHKQSEDHNNIVIGIAVLKKGHEDLRDSTARMDQRNEQAHSKLGEQIASTDHASQERHNTVMRRIDELLRIARNGSGK